MSKSLGIKKRTGQYHHSDLRRALLRAALDVLAEGGGLQSLSLRELARRVGVGSGAPYHHFKERHDLLVALSTEGFERLLLSLKRAGAKSSSIGARLEALARAYLQFADSQPAYYQVMFFPEIDGNPGSEELKLLADSCLLLVADVLPKERMNDSERLQWATGFWALLHGFNVLHQKHLIPDVSRREQERIALAAIAAIARGIAIDLP